MALNCLIGKNNIENLVISPKIFSSKNSFPPKLRFLTCFYQTENCGKFAFKPKQLFHFENYGIMYRKENFLLRRGIESFQVKDFNPEKIVKKCFF